MIPGVNNGEWILSGSCCALRNEL